MLILICDKCNTEEIFKPDSSRHKQFIRPSDKKTIDLCKNCIKEFDKIKEVERLRHLEESLKTNKDFLEGSFKMTESNLEKTKI